MVTKKLIIGDGLLGSYLIDKTKWDYISRKKDKFDFSDINTYSHYLNQYNEIINCVACTDTYSENKDKHWYVNYKGLADLVDYCNKTNKKLIHISTDYLYSGSVENASEHDVPVHCANWYGYTKLLADGYVQLKSNNYTLIRTTQKKKPFVYEFAFENQVGNFDYVDKIGDIIVELINKNANGIYNVGTEVKSMYNLAKQTKEDVKPSNSLFHPTMPTNTTMNTSKLNELLKS